MKVKCKLCGEKGYWELKISEFWASRFLYVSSNPIKT